MAIINESLVLCAIGKGESKIATKLTQETGISSTRISRVLSSLERKKLITRQIGAQDKRCFNFELTTHGAQTVKKMKEAHIPAVDILSNLAESLPENIL